MAAPVFYMKNPGSQEQGHMRDRVVAIVGPTASGKTSLAVRLAQAFDGEVVSCDSRQVYCGLDIGTGKATVEERAGIPHHLLDVANPQSTYTAADFVRDADAAIAGITDRGRLPIVAGGTFFYLEALLGTTTLAGVPSNEALRAQLAGKPPEELLTLLREQDPAYAELVDQHNPHRLIRAIEVATALGAVPAPSAVPRYDALLIGLDVPTEILREKIAAWVCERLDGIREETEQLRAAGLSDARIAALGFVYEPMARHLQGQISWEAAAQEIENKDRQYAKRQRTWLRSMPDVRWFAPQDYAGIEAMVREFLASGGR